MVKGKMETNILCSTAGIASQMLLISADHYYVIDVGDGTLRDLISLKIDFHKIKGIFLTHGHSDHISGLYALLAYFRMNERKDLIDIYYPEKCREPKELIGAFNHSYCDFSFQINIHEVKEGDEIKLNELKIKIFKMRHWAAVGKNRLLRPDVAVGYQFIHPEKTIAISGDTGMCPGLIELVRGVDEAYIDSTLTDEEANDNILKCLHLTRKKAEEIGKLAKKYIPIHLQNNKAY